MGGGAVLGLEHGSLRLVPYCDDWPQLYEIERQRIAAAIGSYVLDIQHIGSTAIPGMVAKPILDIAVAVASFEEAVVCIAPLAALGYLYRGENGLPRRHYFDKGEPLTTHHLHMWERDTEEWARHIRFRDRLRADPALAAEYAALKLRLWAEHPGDRNAYQDGKEVFCARVQAP